MTKFTKQLILLLAIICMNGFTSTSSAADSELPVSEEECIEQMTFAISQADFEKCLQLFDSVLANQEDGPALYCAGYALKRLHKLDEAKSFFQKAAKRNFYGFPGWENSQKILANIETYDKLMPPEMKTYSDDSGKPLIKVYGYPSFWTERLLVEIPYFITHAHEVFGNDVPFTKFVIFKDRESFDKCYEILFSYKPGFAENFGTGMKNVVFFCEEGGENIEELYKREPNYCMGAILHEYGHSLFRTVLPGPCFEEIFPRWIDEGLADIFARYYFAHSITVRDQNTLEKQSKSPPAYSELNKSFDQFDRTLAYALSDFTMYELLGKEPDKLIYPFLKKSCEMHDPNLAAQSLTKKDLEQDYDNVIQKYWGKRLQP